MQLHLTLRPDYESQQPTVAGADWQAASLIHLRKNRLQRLQFWWCPKRVKNWSYAKYFLWSTVRRTASKKTLFAIFEFQFQYGSFSSEKGPVRDDASNNLQSHTVVPMLDNLGMVLEYSNVFLFHLIPLTRVIWLFLLC